VIVATAGHVDHGKSTLVHALTGIDPDRWEEERVRGLTIDLGFAWCRTRAGPADMTLGFVDVPGHRQFLSNMLAGCGVIDIALLAVSAREGWMPQTEEHCQILHLLGVDRGAVALTFADTVDRDQVALVERQVADKLSDTTLSNASIVPTARSQPATIEALRALLTREAERVLAHDTVGSSPDRPRLWIDRSFTLPGAGQVVTGTLGGGSLVLGEPVDLVGQSGRSSARLRDTHVYGKSAPVATPTARVGVSLAKVKRVPERGDALVRADQWTGGRRWQVGLHPVRELSGPIEPRGGYHVYIGATHAAAQLRYPSTELEAADVSAPADGAPPFARLHLAVPIQPVSLGDRFILRDEGRSRTVGGGVILAVDEIAVPYTHDQLLERWNAIHGHRRGSAGAPLSRQGSDALAAVLVSQAGGAAERTKIEALVGPTGPWELLDLASSASESALAGCRLAVLGDSIVGRVAAHRRASELVAAVARNGVVDAPSDTLGRRVAAELERAGLVDQRNGQLSKPGVADHDAQLVTAQASVVAALAAADTPLLADNELRVATGLGSRPIDDLVRSGRLVRIGPFIGTPQQLQSMTRVVHDALCGGLGSTSELRRELGLSRKYTVPVLEALDARGLTSRDGDRRRWVGPPL